MPKYFSKIVYIVDTGNKVLNQRFLAAKPRTGINRLVYGHKHIAGTPKTYSFGSPLISIYTSF